MDYFRLGRLSDRRAAYERDPVRTIKAIVPVVTAVALLHENGLVHRDIKPDNIFVDDDGGLVLGDFGLIHNNEEPRLTETNENTGSSNRMPVWAQCGRLDEVSPAFDTFSLGKVIWYMLSGLPLLPGTYHRQDEYNLEKIAYGEFWPAIVNQFLDQCLTESSDKGFGNAAIMHKKLIDVYVKLNPGLNKLLNRHPSRVESEKERALDSIELPDLSIELLRTASGSGDLIVAESRAGLHVAAGDRQYSVDDNRLVAKFDDAISKLVSAGLLKRVSPTSYKMTESGYQYIGIS